jgi:tetratricopeptide (TPR) repeat protein
VEKRNSPKLKITSADQEWVTQIFQWLIKFCGKTEGIRPIQFNENFFPCTFAGAQVSPENMIKDICQLLDMDPDLFSIDYIKDIRDTDTIPYLIEGAAFRSDLQILYSETDLKKKYLLVLANKISGSLNPLLPAVLLEMTKAKLAEENLIYDEGGLFIHLAAVYFGFGQILIDHLTDVGYRSDGVFQNRWRFRLEVPGPVIIYAMALFYHIYGHDQDPGNQFSDEYREQFLLSAKNIRESKEDLFDYRPHSAQYKAGYFSHIGSKNCRDGQFITGINAFRNALHFTDHNTREAAILYNNIGYFTQRLAKFRESIPWFQKAIAINPLDGYAHDNLGLSLLLTGHHDEGKKFLDAAVTTGRNHPAYSLRNLAVYYMLKEEYELAEKTFMEAFGKNKQVDLLHYYYARLLIKTGRSKEALEHLQIAAASGEQEAIDLLHESFQSE